MKNKHKWYNEIIAFAEGKQIQSNRPSVLDEWMDDYYPLWNDPDTKFRVKPEPKYIPFTFEDKYELRGKWVRHKSAGHEFAIHFINWEGVNGYAWKGALELLEFLDGTPFGKLN